MNFHPIILFHVSAERVIVVFGRAQQRRFNPMAVLNEKRCLSYITQSKEYLLPELYEKISKNIYGCDICQEVCPFNCEVDYHLHPEMEPSGLEFPKISEIIVMTNKEFKSKVRSSSWFVERGIGT